MGLNLPMLLANSQTLDSWSTVSQFSPPMGKRATSTHGSLRVPPQFSTSTTSQHELSTGSRSLFGGSSNNSEANASPQKAMDTTDIEDNKEEAKHERLHSPSSGMTEESSSARPAALGSSAETRTDAGSSPIPNTNTNEVHHAVPAHMPHLAHHAHEHHPHTNQRQLRDQEDLEIKQELVDYFHAPPNMPPAPTSDSNRSYGSNDENRLVGAGGVESDDYAQDLRVSTGSVKGLDFSAFVLPRNQRRPPSPMESIEEKYTPLNMSKLNVTNVTSASAAGNVLMNSLLSNESLSEETMATSGRLKRTASKDASAASAAAAAAIYAECLNRDDCDYVGSNVTLKLRTMDRTQRIIAEKLISEVLFYGQFNELERNARIEPK